jgi:hypothetical protein
VSALSTIWRKGWGLFVDDGSLAAALVIWCGSIGLVMPRVLPGSKTGALLLAAGCVAILLLNVAEAVHRARAR